MVCILRATADCPEGSQANSWPSRGAIWICREVPRAVLDPSFGRRMLDDFNRLSEALLEIAMPIDEAWPKMVLRIYVDGRHAGYTTT